MTPEGARDDQRTEQLDVDAARDDSGYKLHIQRDGGIINAEGSTLPLAFRHAADKLEQAEDAPPEEGGHR